MTHLAVQASNWLKSPPFSEQTVPVVTMVMMYLEVA